MKKKDMVCDNCINYHDHQCCLNPVRLVIDYPGSHWCAKGKWKEHIKGTAWYSLERWGEWEPEK